MISFVDVPKLLGSAPATAVRHSGLNLPHIAPLTTFVEELRAERGEDYQIPYFDPWDGGIAARILFLLEAPGAKAVVSGFISRNNPDETAKNFHELNFEAGIPREDTVTWNIVPWYIGSETRIRPAGKADIREGLPVLAHLLALLPRLRAVVLIGGKAHQAEPHVRGLCPEHGVFLSPHPSPLFVNHVPENRAKILVALQAVKTYVDGLV